MRTFAMIACLTFVSSNALALTPDPWYVAHPAAVTTFKQALAEEHAFFKATSPNRSDNRYWSAMYADNATCTTLRSVKLSCDYNTRIELSTFLTVNGHGLFPAKGGTNPYANEMLADGSYDKDRYGPDDVYIGHGRQNAMLAASVRKNASLFHNGDLKADDVRKRWR